MGTSCILAKTILKCILKLFFRALKILVPVTDFAAIKRSGISPVHCAAAGAHPKCLELLIQAGFDVNFMLDQRIRKHYDDHRKSALYFAVSNGDLSSVKLLLSAGALPNQDPVNCLQIALRMGNYELISLLLRHGANVNYFCRVNPLHFPSALQYTLKDEVMLRMLLNYGYDTERCFDCPHGDKVHPFYSFEGWTSTVIKDTMVSAQYQLYHPVQQIKLHPLQKPEIKPPSSWMLVR
uniref:Ankyrin repeat and SOCS box containing 14 n=1 Tax=Sus scrofa TaxID=9823 RepID=A0A8D1C2J9_PIG